MEGKALAKHIRVSPRKARLIADLIRKMLVKDAKMRLRYLPQKAATIFLRLLKSAEANATNNGLAPDSLVIDEVFVNGAATFKRRKAESKGRGASILKRCSHLFMVVKPKDAEE